MRRPFFLAPVAAALSMTTACARADGVPVFDVTNFAEAVQSVAQLEAQYKVLQQQYGQLVAQYQALTGARGMGLLFDDATAQALRHYAPSSWQQALEVGRGATPGNAGSVADTAQALSHALVLDAASGAGLFPGPANTDRANAFDGLARATVASLAIAESAFDQTTSRAQRLQTYLSEVESAPDAKASADLTNRLLAELVESMQQLVQLQTVFMQLQGRLEAVATVSEHKGSRLWQYHREAAP